MGYEDTSPFFRLWMLLHEDEIQERREQLEEANKRIGEDEKFVYIRQPDGSEIYGTPEAMAEFMKRFNEVIK